VADIEHVTYLTPCIPVVGEFISIKCIQIFSLFEAHYQQLLDSFGCLNLDLIFYSFKN